MKIWLSQKSRIIVFGAEFYAEESLNKSPNLSQPDNSCFKKSRFRTTVSGPLKVLLHGPSFTPSWAPTLTLVGLASGGFEFRAQISFRRQILNLRLAWRSSSQSWSPTWGRNLDRVTAPCHHKIYTSVPYNGVL